ncbi:MAG: AsmA family protein [Myxococcota bacterium]
MRRLVLIAGALLIALVLLTAVLLLLVDPDELREPILALAGDALGREVELEEFDLALLPPALRARQIRIAGATPEEPPFAEIAELRLRVSPLPLLAGRIVLRAVSLERPHLRIPLDAEGRPVLPGAPSPATEALPEPPGGEPDSGDASGGRMTPAVQQGGGRMTLAVQQIDVVDARIEVGPWRVERASARGSLGLDGSAVLEFAADLGELGTVRNGRAELAGVVSGEPRGEVRAEIDLALGALADRLELGQELAGRAVGPVSVTFAAGELEGAQANLTVEGLRASAGPVGLAGDAAVVATLGEGRLLDVVAQLGANELRLRIPLAESDPAIEILPGRLDLGALAPFLSGVPMLSGALSIEGVELRAEPLGLRGTVALEDVALPLAGGEARLSGSLVGRGNELRLAARLEVGDQPATLSGTYDLARGTLTLEVGASGADVAALLQTLRGRSELSGQLEASVRMSGPPDLEALTGSGSFRIDQGRIAGFSLLRQVFGDLAALPALVASMRGKDLSRYEEEEFERLSADYSVADGTLRTDNLTLVYRNAVAYLRGGIALADGALDLSGRVELSREVDEELGKSAGRRTVIPIAGITGTVQRPRVRLDRDALGVLALELATGASSLQEKLEESVGEEAAEAVKDLLERLLGRDP